MSQGKITKPKANIYYRQCNPLSCGAGSCVAVHECAKKVLIQESPGDPPYILQDYCIGCGKCLAVCLFKAIHLEKNG